MNFKSVFRTILLFLIIVITIWLGYRFISKKTSIFTISPIPSENTSDSIFSFFTPKKNPEELRKKINDSLGNSLKNYSIVVKDFTSDFELKINDTEIFTAASVNKIPILTSLYYYAQKEEIDLDRIVTLQEEDIQDYGTGSMRYDPPGTTYSVKTLARLMMQKSDNTAAYILARQVIGMNKMQNLISGWGLSQTDMENNKTSNADMLILMEKIFQEKVANHALTLEMLSFLKDGEIEDRIPALLPKDVTAYHKPGNEIGFLHDVGIVVGTKCRYYIGIFTSDVDDEEKAVGKIAEISKIVYDFLK